MYNYNKLDVRNKILVRLRHQLIVIPVMLTVLMLLLIVSHSVLFVKHVIRDIKITLLYV